MSFLTLDAYNQNVGINTDGSSPESATMLDIKSAGTTSGTFGLKVKSSLGTSHFAVRSDGNVGVNTTTPEGRLEIKNTAGTLGDPHIAIEGSGGQTDDFAIWQPSGLNKLNFGYENGTNTGTIFTLDAGTGSSMLGNVGIGTDSPGSPLHVYAPSWDIIRGERAGTGDSWSWTMDNTRMHFRNWTTEKSVITLSRDGYVGINYTAPSSVLEVVADLDLTLDSNLTFSNAGDLGIGTRTPVNKLHLVDDLGVTSGTHDLAHFGRTGNSEGIRFGYRADGTNYSGGFIRSTDFQPLYLGTFTSNQAITILDNGLVGIGTTTPTQRLTVFNGSTTGTYTTSGWQHSSDKRLKTNIRPISNSLEKVVKLNGVYFNWKANPKEDNQIGFIAQEVQEILPEVVLKNDNGQYTMAYGNITAVLVEAIKEQQDIIIELNAKNNEQKTDIENQKSEINRISARLNLLEHHLNTVNK